MALAAVIIAGLALAWSIGWSIYEHRQRAAGDRTVRSIAQAALDESRRAVDAAEAAADASRRSAESAEASVAIETAREEAAMRAEVVILHWDSRANAPHGAGLVVHNIGRAVARDITAWRLMPTGACERSDLLKTLEPGERVGVGRGWVTDRIPPGRPNPPSASKYLARVHWSDGDGTNRQGDWREIDKL